MTTNPSNQKPTRVAFVITELDVGGAERCLTQLACGLDRSKFEPLVIAIAARPVGDQLAFVEMLEAADVPVHFLGASSKWQLLIAVRRLQQTLREFQPDVVQSFLFHADVLVRLASRWRSWRCLLGLRVAEPSGRRQRLERWASQRAEAVVCVSEAVRQYARSSVKIPAEKLRVIPNAVDVNAFQTAAPLPLESLGVPTMREAILCVGRLHSQKGLDWLLSQLADVFVMLPEHDLLIVGSGPEEASLRAQVKREGLADRVHFAGWRSDIPRLMASASMLVLPSRWEGMPNVVLEAMASGLPVVAAKTHGVDELLGAHQDEQTFVFGDGPALIQRLSDVGQNPSLAQQLGEANLARVRRHFSLEAMVTAYQSLYATPPRG